jgi:hypothetical protein
MVNMVNDHIRWRFYNLAVHLYFSSLITDYYTPRGIIGIFTLGSIPFVFAQSLVVFGIDDGVFALCQWDAAEGIAVADAAI